MPAEIDNSFVFLTCFIQHYSSIMEASSSNPPNMIFDIFLSFIGDDVQDGFVEYLNEALCNLGLATFMTDKKLLIGDRLSERQAKTIEEAEIAIVVISKDYVDSKWCLRALAKIIECKDTIINRVFPVFYHVNPRDVRNQYGTFGESIEVYEKSYPQLDSNGKEIYTKEEIKQWRKALTTVGGLLGVVVEKDRPELNACDKITNQIFDMLRRPKLVSPDKLNSLEDITNRLNDIDNLYDSQSKEVRFIGIIGMSGIGKTTIAEVLYDKIAYKLEYINCCFLTISGHDLVSVQRLLLSQLLRIENIKISQESEGADLIQRCLSRRKVFIVLDGVDDERQLEYLAGNFDWFGPKSRIIITTSHKDVFSHPNFLNVQVYNVPPLSDKASFSLFCKCAFGGEDKLDENFRNLSKEIVEKVVGHPHALYEIGSFLYLKGIDIWEEQLKRFVLADHKRLFQKLKICYEKLESRSSQQVFLDLTCFFNGKSRSKVIEILGSLGYSPHTVIDLLRNRHLIEIKDGDKIYIQTLVQQMGQQIARDESPQSRIWLRKDVFDIFDQQHGLKHIKGVVLDKTEEKHELELKPHLFKDMNSLRILEIDNVKLLPRSLEYLSNQLRWLYWHGYPSHSLPINFEAPYLFELQLPVGETTHLWNGLKRFEKLKVIDASDSLYLVETPNLSQVPSLERLVLRNCIRLHSIDNSIITLNHLLLLDFSLCIRLKTFNLMGNLRKHTTVELGGSGLRYPNTSSQAAARQPNRGFFYQVKKMFK